MLGIIQQAKRYFVMFEYAKGFEYNRLLQVPTITSGSNSVVESRLPKPLVAGSIPVSRSKL